MTSLPQLRKRLLEAEPTTSAGTDNEIDIVGCATIAYSSEDPAHPIEHAFDGRGGPGAKRWISARPDTVERIIVEFDEQPMSRLVYEVEEAVRERTQEVCVEVSEKWRSNVPPNFDSGIQFQPQRSHLPARRTALQSSARQASSSHDCPK